MKSFILNEMENIFEIGRMAQHLIDTNVITGDSKEIFNFALGMAVRFEEEYPETETYYDDIEEFVLEKLLREFGDEESAPLVCRGCENAWAHPSHVKCHGCARMYTDNYKEK